MGILGLIQGRIPILSLLVLSSVQICEKSSCIGLLVKKWHIEDDSAKSRRRELQIAHKSSIQLLFTRKSQSPAGLELWEMRE